MSDPSARPILAALANRESRGMFARVVLDAAPVVPSPREKRALAQLESAGLIVASESGWTVAEDHLRTLLQQGATPRPKTGPERYLTPDGRIDRMPPHREREEFLLFLAPRVADVGDALSEPELNARLASLTDDVPVLRRMFVDHGVLTRDPAGIQYSRPR